MTDLGVSIHGHADHNCEKCSEPAPSFEIQLKRNVYFLFIKIGLPEYKGPKETPPPEYPSCRHRTSASLLSQPSAQIVPFIPCFSTTTVAGKLVKGRIWMSVKNAKCL